MNKLTASLIRLGEENPSLREHLKPVLDVVTASSPDRKLVDLATKIIEKSQRDMGPGWDAWGVENLLADQFSIRGYEVSLSDIREIMWEVGQKPNWDRYLSDILKNASGDQQLQELQNQYKDAKWKSITLGQKYKKMKKTMGVLSQMKNIAEGYFSGQSFVADVTNEREAIQRIQNLISSLKSIDRRMDDFAYETDDAVESFSELVRMLKART